MKLYCPTVKDMIEALQKFPPDKSFCIEDTDTWWIIRDFDITEDDKDVTVSTSYNRISSSDSY